MQIRLIMHTLVTLPFLTLPGSLVCRSGMLAAFLIFAWGVGGWIGTRFTHWGQPVLWGGGMLGWGCLWFCLLVPQSLFGGMVVMPKTWIFPAMLLCVATLGGCQGGWQAGRAIGEWTTLVTTASGVMALCIAFLLPPRWADLVGIAGIVPLLFVDACSRGDVLSLSPLPCLETRTLPHGWWIIWLQSRGRLCVTLLSMSIAVILNVLFTVAPAVFGLALVAVGKQTELLWLLGGQVLSLLCCGCVLPLVRGLLGHATSPFPRQWRRHAVWFLCIAFGCIAVGLIGLGLTSSGALCACFILYDVAFLSWTVVAPRVFQPLTCGPDARALGTPFLWLKEKGHGQKRFDQIIEQAAQQRLALWQRVFSFLLMPLVGLSIDFWGVDPSFEFAGALLLLSAGGICCMTLCLRMFLPAFKHPAEAWFHRASLPPPVQSQ